MASSPTPPEAAADGHSPAPWRAIAESLKASAECSERRKATPFASAMAMLNFYLNRAGRQLPAEQRAVLEAAKDELRALYGRPRRQPPSDRPPS